MWAREREVGKKRKEIVKQRKKERKKEKEV